MGDIVLRLLYLMDNPHGGLSVKVGSSGLEKYPTRIGNYQQGNGPDYLVTWPVCYIGEQSVVNRLEERIITPLTRKDARIALKNIKKKKLRLHCTELFAKIINK